MDAATAISLWKRSDGRTAEPPEWYSVIVCARYLGVAPWDLEQHPEWLARAKEAMLGELRASRAVPLNRGA